MDAYEKAWKNANFRYRNGYMDFAGYASALAKIRAQINKSRARFCHHGTSYPPRDSYTTISGEERAPPRKIPPPPKPPKLEEKTPR